ncbi:MAG: calcium-binding protein [Caulobacterales bacterium]|nr:calcium-binding protein [Caulobacterales bacterium]
MDAVHLSALNGQPVLGSSPLYLMIDGPGGDLYLGGQDLQFDGRGHPIGGTIGHVQISIGSFTAQIYTLTDPLISASQFGQWVAADATQLAFSTILSGPDDIDGGPDADLLRGYDGDDVIRGLGGDNTVFGGQGNDTISGYGFAVTLGAPGANYLRGEEGDDRIVGGSLFDDINGNQGADTCSGGGGDDWVVGGKDNDSLSGDAGGDLVYGNLGADTCDGGDGNDIVRGGQDNDVVMGGAGDDFVSGDKGDDTMTGGAGADIFHTFGDAGLDRVTDFHASEGDRVQLDPGTVYTAAQVGADTVIDMTGGGQMVLVGVTLSSLPSGWIFGA